MIFWLRIQASFPVTYRLRVSDTDRYQKHKKWFMKIPAYECYCPFHNFIAVSPQSIAKFDCFISSYNSVYSGGLADMHVWTDQFCYILTECKYSSLNWFLVLLIWKQECRCFVLNKAEQDKVMLLQWFQIDVIFSWQSDVRKMSRKEICRIFCWRSTCLAKPNIELSAFEKVFQSVQSSSIHSALPYKSSR